MIWFLLVLVAAGVLAPLLLTVRSRKTMRSRRDLALALHRAQLAEIDRDLAAERISPEDHATARLEIQRRILAAADTAPDAEDAEAGDAVSRRGPSLVLLASLVAIPLGASFLYALGGHPDLPGAPLAGRMLDEERQENQEAELIEKLRDRLATLDQTSDQARQGYVLLGNAENSRGNLPAAIDAWKRALDVRFDATLAARTADAMTRVSGRMTLESDALFRKALAAAPTDAPWRDLVEKRLAEAK